MATVHLARLFGEEGFSRIVAVKRLHPQFARDEDFVTMFLNEARLMSRIHHPNVIAPLDIVRVDNELFIVMEHVYGESVARLARAMDGPIPTSIAVGVSIQTLLGLHAAHEATDAYGQPLQIVHRDVSPQNILVGADGISRVVDFGIAKAAFCAHTTRDGQIKGKFGYFAPEQLSLTSVDRRTDVFTAAIVLWEMLTGRRLFAEGVPTVAAEKILGGRIVPPSEIVGTIPHALDAVVLHGLALSPSDRFQDARSMALELEVAVTPASALETGAWVQRLAAPALARRESLIARLDVLSLSDLTLPLRRPDSRVPPQTNAQTNATVAKSFVSRLVRVRSSASESASARALARQQVLSCDVIERALPTSSAVSLDQDTHQTRTSRKAIAARRHVIDRRYFLYAALALASGTAAMTIVPHVAPFSRSSVPSTAPVPTANQHEPTALARPEASLDPAAVPSANGSRLTAAEVLPMPSARSVSRLAPTRRSVSPPTRSNSSRSSASRRPDASGGSSNCRKAFDDKGLWTLTCSPK
jgi:serine/threonine protein kinase